jgi:hypothetical protein
MHFQRNTRERNKIDKDVICVYIYIYIYIYIERERERGSTKEDVIKHITKHSAHNKKFLMNH